LNAARSRKKGTLTINLGVERKKYFCERRLREDTRFIRKGEGGKKIMGRARKKFATYKAPSNSEQL